MVHFEKKEKYVLISGEGERKGLLAIQERSKQMYEFVVESQCHLLINISVAVVLNSQNLALGKTWTGLGNARGFNFKIFNDVTEAETWLIKQQHN